MEYLGEWLKTILYMNVLLVIVESLVQKTKYESYVKFFSGILLMLCLMKPVVDWANAESLAGFSYLKNQWESERKLLPGSGEFRRVEEEMRENYEEAVKNQIVRMAQGFSFVVTETGIDWDRKREKVAKIFVCGRQKEDGSFQKEEFCEALAGYFDLEPEDVEIAAD
ncbi:MAG: stage III sporulation protein AF [Eubacteriales bacterium]|nr:stage III sporulation protein AF [Eubacteriales bacterium]